MTNSAFQGLDDAMQARRQVFSVLSRLLGREVDEELLATLKEGGMLSSDDEALSGAIGLIEGYLASEGSSKLDLDRDYAKAFCGAGSTNKDSAYPFESFYTSKERLLMQEARDDALRWYRRFGVQKADDWHDCEDHVGVELEFVVHLIDEWRRAAAEGNEARAAELLLAQRDFERTHLANWLPLFAIDVRRRARTDFYIGLAQLADAYVAQDVATLGELVGDGA
ncbi:MAG: molecular chaperone TorD family protein [Eggerthellaceae bacterium]|nr:molecular chaperone TorD family protein [Eggerthellaceae bacterium]